MLRPSRIGIRSACGYAFCRTPLHAETDKSAEKLFRVCADPNNLPFSNQAGEGFENKLAKLIAADLGETVSTTWWAQRRGNIRTLSKRAPAMSSWACLRASTWWIRRGRIIAQPMYLSRDG